MAINQKKVDALVKKGEETIDPKLACGIFIGKDGDKTIEVRIGKFGPFLSDNEGTTSALPSMMCPDELTLEKAKELLSSNIND